MQVEELSTEDLPRHEQIPAWERFTAAHMVQLSCHSLSPSLRARQRSVHTSKLRGVLIEAEAHTIFRPEERIHGNPTGLVQISTVEGGEVYFQHSAGVSRIAPGSALIFDTDLPYSVTFGTSLTFRSVLVPRELLTASPVSPGAGPVVVPIPASLRRAHEALFAEGATPPAVPSAAELVAALTLPDPMVERFASVLAVLQRRYRDSDLNADRVAAETYLSTRQLSRVLSTGHTSLLAQLTAIRLDSVREELADPRLRGFGISEIFHRNGFRSHSHGHRRFLARFGQTPGEFRRSAAASG